MMFQKLGLLVARAWPAFVAVWGIGLLTLALLAPRWEDVTDHGETSVLPQDAPSNLGQEFLAKAFPSELVGSSVVIVMRRPGEPLRDADKAFIQSELEPALDELTFQAEPPSDKPVRRAAASANHADAAPEGPPILRVQTLNTKGVGPLLVSHDKQATVAVIDLTARFQDRRGWSTIQAIEDLLEKLRQDDKAPPGLELGVTGSAVIGRDVLQLESQSAKEIEIWTIIFVVILLLAIYRALLLAVIPLLTVFVAVQISIYVLSVLAGMGLVSISDSLRIYITVLAYGAGVDYCLFLSARYHEELLGGQSAKESLAHAIGKVGAALTASAGTVIAGIGMLAFGRFTRYHQAGISIPLSLALVLLCTLTLTAALLCLAGRWAFWPRRLPSVAGRSPGSAPARPSRPIARIWHWVGAALLRRPATIWLACVAVLMPFAVVAVVQYNRWDYGVVRSMPAHVASVRGTQMIMDHFSPGLTAPVTVLIHDDAVEFRSTAGRQAIAGLVERLKKRKQELQIADVRSLATPTGITAASEEAQADIAGLDRSTQIVLRERAVAHYISEAPDLEGHVTRMNFVLNLDPLSHTGIQQLHVIRTALFAELPTMLRSAAVHFIGPTAGLRDLQEITTGDLRRIEILVPVVVLLILIVLLREVLVSVYLIASVLFSYFVTLGITFTLFWALDPANFAGLDWKVPILLFAILVAVGEDYNIFLMTRVKEEQAVHGRIRGIIAALVKTGGIISSCGIIMAGTFISLLVGSLVELKQLGFALAVGVLLDTLVVRPVLVPAFLILMERRRRPATARGGSGVRTTGNTVAQTA